MSKDTYNTLASESEGLYKEKGSKFYSFAYPVCDECEIKEKISELGKKFHDARHVCYAWMIGVDKKAFRVNDDGEPSGTAGNPILGQIKSFDITNVLIVVVRYFGGTLLGKGGLVKAYRESAKEAVLNNSIVEKTVDLKYKIDFDYIEMNNVMKILKDDNINIMRQSFEDNCYIVFSVRKSLSDLIESKLTNLDNVKLEPIE